MKRVVAAPNPDAYVAALEGWRADTVRDLRAIIAAAAPDAGQIIKWGNLVFVSDGLMALIRAEDHRVLLGFWRGKRLAAMEPRIRPSGKYELGNWTFRQGDGVAPDAVTAVVREAVALNRRLGDPTRRTPE